jgi:hypothetical protein
LVTNSQTKYFSFSTVEFSHNLYSHSAIHI